VGNGRCHSRKSEKRRTGGRSARGSETPRKEMAIPIAYASTIGTTGGNRPLSVLPLLFVSGVEEEVLLRKVDPSPFLPILFFEAFAEETTHLQIGMNPRNKHDQHP
jgi:hypothetical protein